MMRTAWCLICGWLAGSGALLAVAAPLPVEWREQVRRLGAEDFAERQAAQQVLAGTPTAAALPWLVEIASDPDAETSARAVQVLERWLLTAPLEVADAVEVQLEALSASEHPSVARAAEDALLVQRRLRQQRAVAVLRELGAKVDVGPDLDALAILYNAAHEEVDASSRDLSIEAQIEATSPDRALLVIDEELQDPGEPPAKVGAAARDLLPQVPRQVFLTARWKGGDEGARHLRRLKGVGTLHVYVVRGCNTSLTAVQAATAEIYEVQVQERGPSLGVGNGSAFECLVGRVLAGGAADRAGIEQGNVILGVGETPISSFFDLVNAVAEYEPGDKVDVVVQDGFQVTTKTVTLGDWTDVDTEGELWKPQDGRGWVPRRAPFFFPAQPPLIPPPQNDPAPLPIDALPPRDEAK